MSSQEKLDQLLSNGKITDAEYLKLSKALTKDEEQQPDEAKSQSEAGKGKLKKNFEKGVFAGVFAGIADHYNTDVIKIRVSAVIAFFILFLFNGAALLLLPLYFVVAAMLPFDEQEKAVELRKKGCDKAFFIEILVFFFLIPFLYSGLLLPRLLNIYEQLGLEVWSSSFQATFYGRAIDLASEYKSYLTFSDPSVIWMYIITAFLVAFAMLVYSSLCNAKMKKGIHAGILIAGIGWNIFIVAGTYFPIFTMAENVR